MPYPEKLQFALDKLIDPKILANDEKKDGGLIQKEQSSYLLKETKEEGYTELTVLVDNTNLCITEFDKTPKWGIINQKKELGLKKFVDNVILTLSDDGTWKAHLIEMKTGMGNGTFENVRAKIRANYYSVKALCVYLGIKLNDDDFDVYVTYENMRMPSDPALMKAPVGKKPSNVIKSEWEKNRIIIKVPDELELPLIPIKMKRIVSANSPMGSALVGEIKI